MRYLKFGNMSSFALSITLSLLIPFLASAQKIENDGHIRKVLFIGDSMTGWMAERLNAYGEVNDFEVATVVWDGSTISKWAASKRLSSIIKQQDPDVIFVSLGMNELLEKNPSVRLAVAMEKIKHAFGDIPFLWIGPPSWPGKPGGEALNAYLAKELGEEQYFQSSSLLLQRQSKANPHPSRAGICAWIDAVADWIPAHTQLRFQSLKDPGTSRMSRGKTFIYKRMRETL
mgnify:CR=1 FL=1